MRIHRHRQHKPRILIPQFNINEKITAKEVRVVGPDINGVLSLKEALSKAKDLGLDLVEVSPKANPPVCKILDYGTFKYQKEKEIKKQRAASKEVEIKGIRISLRIGDGDRDIRLKKAKAFLDDGKKLRIELILRGRERGYRDRAIMVMNDFVKLIKETHDVRVESPVKSQGGRMQTIVSRTSN